jgi:two-component system sensor kinase FixL
MGQSEKIAANNRQGRLRQAEQARDTPTSSTEARLRAMVETAVDGIFTIDAKGTIRSLNPAAERLFGYTAEEVIGQHVRFLMSLPEGAAHHDALAAYLQTGEKRLMGSRREVTGQRKDGTSFPLELAVSEVHVGNQRFFTGIMRDLTARQQLEVELRRTERLAVLGRLAASLTHELRDPLHALLLHAEVVEAELRTPTVESQAQMAASVADIKIEIARLDDLIEDYLSLARLATLRRESADLGRFVRACCHEFEEPLASCGVTLTLDGLDRLGRIAFHPSALRGALRNLMRNALEAMPQGGTLTLRGQRTPTHVHLAISDTGIGIPADEVPLIFEPLHTTKPEGTGLGLYLVREIMAAHDGHIEVQSTLGQGTTFNLTLPAGERSAADS